MSAGPIDGGSAGVCAAGEGSGVAEAVAVWHAEARPVRRGNQWQTYGGS